MKYHFCKMQGCGNDYIYLNGMNQEILSPDTLSVRLSDRHFGVGGDGIVLILPSAAADARMRMFNADGSEGRMCGNAIRCVGKYLYEKGIVKKERMSVETLSGMKGLELALRNGRVISVKVDMGPAELEPARIPTLLEGRILPHKMQAFRVPAVVNRLISLDGDSWAVTCVSMGNPHAVVFTEDVSSLPLNEIGPKFEKHPLFPESVNVEFVRVINSRALEMRVWERGSGETLACGTGACASVAAAVLNDYCPMAEDIQVNLLGGQLTVRYTEETVFMTGGCETVFEGVIDIV